MDTITDAQIKEYIKEKKTLPQNFKPIFKERNGQNCFEKEIIGDSGNIFKIIIRQSKFNSLDFSVIFSVLINGVLFRIRRYNGDSHDHTNKIERETIDGFHIHMATERYQENGFKEEGFAEKTTRYNDWQTALKVMITENNFQMEVPKDQQRLNLNG